MKRLFGLAVLAVGVLAFSCEEASAFGRRGGRMHACNTPCYAPPLQYGSLCVAPSPARIPGTTNCQSSVQCPGGRDCPPNCRLIPNVYRFERMVSATETEFTIRNDRNRPVKLYLADQTFSNNSTGPFTCIFGGRPIIVDARSEYPTKFIRTWYRDSQGRRQGTLLWIYDMEEM